MKLTSGRIRRASRISSCVLPSLARSTMHSALKVRHQSEDAYVLVGGSSLTPRPEYTDFLRS